tara:strand:- start:71 stop:1687 length:1617 start_codon:yes stop_codon:yes gene_type:complete
MGLILSNSIYSLVFFLLTLKEMITDKYDHDIDQFMYFGSRILHGELIWTKEFDDKSPIIQFIFSLPATLKSTNIFVLITLIVSIIGGCLGYKMLKDILEESELDIHKKDKNSILYFGTILYLTLLVCIYGSLHHINAISSSLCLITISITYLNQEKRNKILTNVAAITSALSISIRPYYLINIFILPIWLSTRSANITERKIDIYKSKKFMDYFMLQLNWILIITFYIILFNVTPYILSGNLSNFVYGIKLNSVDYINHNVFLRQYINIGRNPILYPLILAMIILPLTRIFFQKIINNYYKKKENGLIKLYKLDVDILFFGIFSPLLLEVMFYKKHFFGHYFTLFSPYIFISIVILLALLARINKLINNLYILKYTIKSIFIISIIICLITNQSLPNAISEILNKNSTNKSDKLYLTKEFLDKERVKSEDFGFLAPNDNYIHWKLDESRHGFPQKAVFRNIANGRMDKLTKKFDSLDYKFLLPNKAKLCETLSKNGPEYIITERNDFSFNCLKKQSSEYELLTSTKILNENNIYVFKR